MLDRFARQRMAHDHIAALQAPGIRLPLFRKSTIAAIVTLTTTAGAAPGPIFGYVVVGSRPMTCTRALHGRRAPFFSAYEGVQANQTNRNVARASKRFMVRASGLNAGAHNTPHSKGRLFGVDGDGRLRIKDSI
jgi:hypothetical protein